MTGIDRTNVTGAAAQSDAATIYVCITCRRAQEPEAEPQMPITLWATIAIVPSEPSASSSTS